MLNPHFRGDFGNNSENRIPGIDIPSGIPNNMSSEDEK
jgi:hypothetical protein